MARNVNRNNDWPKNFLSEIYTGYVIEIMDNGFDMDNLPEDIEGTILYLASCISPRLPEIIELRYKRGLTINAIGEQLGISKTRVDQLLKKGIRCFCGRRRNLEILGVGMKQYMESMSCKSYQKGEEDTMKREHPEDISKKTISDYDPIESLGLSTRSLKALTKVNGAETISDLMKLYDFLDGDFGKIRNLGAKSVQEINEKMIEYGLIKEKPVVIDMPACNIIAFDSVDDHEIQVNSDISNYRSMSYKSWFISGDKANETITSIRRYVDWEYLQPLSIWNSKTKRRNIYMTIYDDDTPIFEALTYIFILGDAGLINTDKFIVNNCDDLMRLYDYDIPSDETNFFIKKSLHVIQEMRDTKSLMDINNIKCFVSGSDSGSQAIMNKIKSSFKDITDRFQDLLLFKTYMSHGVIVDMLMSAVMDLYGKFLGDAKEFPNYPPFQPKENLYLPKVERRFQRFLRSPCLIRL